ncbi:MAG: HlyD family efflux transporter periplasmic adaptor subunit [Thermoguttaceae bacterium]
MVSLRDSLLSSSARSLPIRKRPDLVSQREHYLGRAYWVVKDPVGLNYFRFQEEEYALLNMLDGQTSLDEIKERFEAEFPPQKITLEELQQFLGMLHRSGLVLADAAGQGRQLHERRNERKRRELLAAVSNVLCIRFKGFDPERLLTRIYPWVRWLFSPAAVAVCLLLALSALTLVTVEFDRFHSKLPEFHQFFSVHNGFLLVLTLAVTKILHEFGHGLSCKHFGGECHEMGVMVLVLTPCLYCNVSDSWMLPNKWHRAAIGAAGVYVELVLASIATLLWWFSRPGLFQFLCLDVMFISSITTVMFNANPLLRYDGYYVLADLMEIPNLRQKATAILTRTLNQWCLGLEPPDDPFLPQRHQLFFVLYSIAAAVYRWVITFSICWFLYRLFLSYDLEVIGQVVVLASLWGLLIMPLYHAGKFFYVPGRIDQIKKPRFYTSAGVFGALVLAVLFLPLPHSVMCTLEVQPRDADPVYIDVAGKLVRCDVVPGQQVSKGQPLGEIQSLETDVAVARLEGSIKEYGAKRESLRQQSIRNPRAADEMPQVTEALRAFEDQLKEKQRDQQRLHLTAPQAGAVLPPPLTVRHDPPDERLSVWAGTPLDPENVGAFFEAGTLFCQIGDPKRLEAVLVVDQADRNLVRAGQTVDLKLEGLPFKTFRGTITEIAESELKIMPKRLATTSGGELPTKTDPDTGIQRPQSTSYQARVPLDDPDGLVRLGIRGQARVYTDWITLGTRFWRLVHQLFNFKV